VAEDPRPIQARILARWRQVALILGAVVLVNVALDVLVLRRSVRVSGDRQRLLDDERGEVAGVRQRLDGLERASSKLACVESDVAHVFDDVLSSKSGRMTAIQREIRQLAKEHVADPENIAFSYSEVKGTGLVRFTISFPLQGSYETLRHFIKAVEDSQNFLIVQDIGLTEESAGGALHLNVDLVTYFQSPEMAAITSHFPAATGPS
jgi:Tfp pilus assembly protein PilO